MKLSRRQILQGAGGISLAAAPPASARPSTLDTITLPDRQNYLFEGVHLNAAYTHPIGVRSARAGHAYIETRMTDLRRNWPITNARDEAAALYARLVNAEASDIAVVPSTLEGENLIAEALALGPGAGVVSDSLHYDASLVMYGEKAKAGMPFTTLAPIDGRIDYEALERAITPDIRLVAVSHVSSMTGFRHDLKRVCDIAHAKGAMVYADVIQSVGAIPLDVKDSGVDFCCAGHYKWMQGEFGAAFLYVRPDRLAALNRVQIGWRGVAGYDSHVLPFQTPGPPEGSWTLEPGTAQMFEVSTANWSGLATTAESLRYLLEIGIDRIAAHRQPMLDRLQEVLPLSGWVPLAPSDSQGPAVVFTRKGAGTRLRQTLLDANIHITVYADRVRISPSLHNSMGDIDRLVAVLAS